MPVTFRLYLPEIWTKDRQRRKKTGVPHEIQFQTKTEIALEQIQRARQREIPQGVVLADAGYGVDTGFRTALTKMELSYVLGVQSSVTVWRPGEEPKPAPARRGRTGRPRKLLQRDAKHQPVSAKELARSLPLEAWKRVTWRQGVKRKLQSRFAALRVRPAHRDYWRAEPHPEEWLLIEWPADEKEPTKYWLSTLPADIALIELVQLAKHRWIIERDYQELKQELGLGHYEGRGWRGFHHHATLCIAAYGFWWPNGIVLPPPRASAILDYQLPYRRRTSDPAVRRVRPERHSPGSITTLRMILAPHLLGRIPHCPFCGSRSG